MVIALIELYVNLTSGKLTLKASSTYRTYFLKILIKNKLGKTILGLVNAPNTEYFYFTKKTLHISLLNL